MGVDMTTNRLYIAFLSCREWLLDTSDKGVISRKITILLLIYFVFTITLRLTGWGNVVFTVDMFFMHLKNPQWRYLYYYLPLFMCFYNEKKGVSKRPVYYYVFFEKMHLIVSGEAALLLVGWTFKPHLSLIFTILLWDYIFIILWGVLIAIIDKLIRLYLGLLVEDGKEPKLLQRYLGQGLILPAKVENLENHWEEDEGKC
jgi:hypothetical protein